jgi:hypothetical protein
MSNYPANLAPKIQFMALTKRYFVIRQLVDRVAHQHV